MSAAATRAATRTPPAVFLLRDLRRTALLYDQLDALLPGTKTGRHPDEATSRATGEQSSIPIQLGHTDHMRALEDFLAAWISRARMLTDPHARMRFSRDYAVACPLCEHMTLVAWPAHRGGIITCTAGCGQWIGPGGWARLRAMLVDAQPGRLAEPCIPLDARRRARPNWAALAAAISA